MKKVIATIIMSLVFAGFIPVHATGPRAVHVIAQPAQPEDDGWAHEDCESLNLPNAALRLGYDTESYTSGAIRFVDVGVPPGATIVASHISFVSTGNMDLNDARVVLKVERSSNAAPLTDRPELWGREFVFRPVYWSLGKWRSGGAYHTPSLRGQVQEVVRLPGWQEGNAVLFAFVDIGSTPGAFRAAASWDHETLTPPTLHIYYEAKTALGKTP